jgi:hypothetical protein
MKPFQNGGLGARFTPTPPQVQYSTSGIKPCQQSLEPGFRKLALTDSKVVQIQGGLYLQPYIGEAPFSTNPPNEKTELISLENVYRIALSV